MAPAPPPPPPAAPPVDDSIVIREFSGLRNTISPERLSPKELARGRNIDIDDAEQIHRRRGQRLALIGNFASLFNTEGGSVYVVMNGQLGRLYPNYSFMPIVAGIAPDPLSYVQIGPTLYFSSASNSGIINLRTLEPGPWGEIGGSGFWFSPVVHPTTPPLAGPGTPSPNVPLVGPGFTLPL